ncbi:MAG: glycosyltransferase [Desulfomicrobium sp.]|nr:glycosyltransferase [Desulfomicrobium sp.]
MISVIMGTHRLDPHLAEAIQSVLNQTFSEFEFIIVPNGPEAEKLKTYIQEQYSDQRINIITSSIPQLAHALNLGLDHAKYDLIARMDADDIAYPDRFDKQIKYLFEKSLDMVGSNLELINEEGVCIGTRILPRGSRINQLLPYKNCFAHNTLLVKKSILIQARGYNSGFNSEDYDLWLRLKRMGVRWDNMPEPLVQYRIHDQASQRKLLGYAEAAGYSLREFILKKSFRNFLAIFVHLGKALVRPR